VTREIARVKATDEASTADVAACVPQFKRLLASTLHRARFFSTTARLQNTQTNTQTTTVEPLYIQLALTDTNSHDVEDFVGATFNCMYTHADNN